MINNQPPKSPHLAVNVEESLKCVYAKIAVAQLDRAMVFGTIGYRFDSYRAYYKS